VGVKGKVFLRAQMNGCRNTKEPEQFDGSPEGSRSPGVEGLVGVPLYFLALAARSLKNSPAARQQNVSPEISK
jgi:hypothetical protein